MTRPFFVQLELVKYENFQSSLTFKVRCDLCIACLRYSLMSFRYHLRKMNQSCPFLWGVFGEKTVVERSYQPQRFQTWPRLHYSEAEFSLTLKVKFKHISLGIERDPVFVSYLS